MKFKPILKNIVKDKKKSSILLNLTIHLNCFYIVYILLEQ
jgi:hypothetical protein